MKKIKQLIDNIYRICVVNSMGRKSYTSYKEKTGAESNIMSDSMLRQIIAEDQLPFKADPQIRRILRQRVTNNGHHTAPAKNSLLDIFVPLFTSQHIEIKLAVISLTLFILLGLGPKNNQDSERKMHLFFLADTLGDSSSFHHPAAQDTAFRVQYK
jgi:hypothetical protein